jgi:hypothetical protein
MPSFIVAALLLLTSVMMVLLSLSIAFEAFLDVTQLLMSFGFSGMLLFLLRSSMRLWRCLTTLFRVTLWRLFPLALSVFVVLLALLVFSQILLFLGLTPLPPKPERLWT